MNENLVAEFWYAAEYDVGYVRFVPDSNRTRTPITNSYGYNLVKWKNYKALSTAKGYTGDETDWDYEGDETLEDQRTDLEKQILEHKRKLAHLEKEIPDCLYTTESTECIICGKAYEVDFDWFEESGEWVESD